MVRGFSFDGPRYPQSRGVAAPQQGVWGPPDMADMLMKGIGSLGEKFGAAYTGVNQQMNQELLQKELIKNGISPAQQLQNVGQFYGGGGGSAGAGSGAGAPTGRPPSMLQQGGNVSPSIGAIDPVAQGLTPQQAGLLNGISTGESAGKYDVRYTPRGGATFDLNGAHPGIYEQGPAGPSSAAGRYQFTKKTWDEVTGGNVPFTPENQDKYAIVLAQRDYNRRTGRDLDTDLATEGFSPRIQAALSPTWAALRSNHGRNAAAFNATLERASGGGGMQMPAGTQGQGQGPIARALAPENNRPIPQPTWQEQGRAPAPPGPQAGAQMQQQGNNPGQGRVQVASNDPNFVPASPALAPKPEDQQAAGQVVAAQTQHTQAQNAPGPSSRSFMGLPSAATPGSPVVGPVGGKVLPPGAQPPLGTNAYPGSRGVPVAVPPPTGGQPAAASPPSPQPVPAAQGGPGAGGNTLPPGVPTQVNGHPVVNMGWDANGQPLIGYVDDQQQQHYLTPDGRDVIGSSAPLPGKTAATVAPQGGPIPTDTPAATAQPAQGPLPPQVAQRAAGNPDYARLLAYAIGSGNPAAINAIYGLATNEGQKKQYQFIESGGVVYQADPYGGGVKPVAGQLGGAGYEIIKPTDTARRAQLGIDPKDNRIYQMNRKDGKLEHITPEQMKDNPQFSQEMQLSNQFEGLKPVQSYRQMEDAVLGLESAFKQGNSQGDMLAVVGLFKTIDPNSTVSGAEVATAQNTAGVPDYLRQLYNQAVGNGRVFSPELRAKFWNAAQGYLKSRQGGVQRLAEDWSKTAKNNGLNVENVVRWRPWEFKSASKDTFPDTDQPNENGGGRTPAPTTTIVPSGGSTVAPPTGGRPIGTSPGGLPVFREND